MAIQNLTRMHLQKFNGPQSEWRNESVGSDKGSATEVVWGLTPGRGASLWEVMNRVHECVRLSDVVSQKLCCWLQANNYSVQVYPSEQCYIWKIVIKYKKTKYRQYYVLPLKDALRLCLDDATWTAGTVRSSCWNWRWVDEVGHDQHRTERFCLRVFIPWR